MGEIVPFGPRQLIPVGGGWRGGGSDTQYNCVTCTQLTLEECQHSHNHTQSGQ